jgi:hypothetical protein
MKILNILFLTLSLNSFCQVSEITVESNLDQAYTEDTIPKKEIVDFPDKTAEFPGGMENFRMYIANHIVYPQTALIDNIQGKVYASFIVNIDGTISDVKIMRGLRKDCDKEVIRMILAMPK